MVVLLVAAGVGFVFAFEFYIKDEIGTTEVIIAKETIDFKERITANNIEVIHVRQGTEVENAYPKTHFESLMGKYASVKIEKGAQLYPELIDTYDLVPDASKGEFVAPIPTHWLFAVPGSLRRTFVADIYAIGTEDQKIISKLKEDAAKEAGKDPEEVVVEPTPTSEPILKNLRITSVKDSGNQEVKESEETNEATGTVAALEFIGTEEMLNTMKDYTSKGFKLYVVYKFERSEQLAAETETAKAGESNAE
ncbi:hypothetical protein B0X71_19450 (plasmid) [Planococcus lenghuensis]|uniref:SAF domain-containing protein n=2 Tax=Planococcus lenghuensis TaxID=2213202 RepID=A0A1Q2L5Y3_9BACL|nr:hypothetical protein B0X71_19450 [Planococcus lenghuensis]